MIYSLLSFMLMMLSFCRLGRRKSLVVFMSLATLFLVALAVLDLTYGTLLSAVTVSILSLCGKFGVAGARSAVRMLTGESFPTAIRTMGYGISGVTAGVGGIIAPQIAFLGTICKLTI
jgi:MFS family permease